MADLRRWKVGTTPLAVTVTGAADRFAVSFETTKSVKSVTA